MDNLLFTFSGLCLFVPASDGGELQVLMPTHPGGKDPKHEHIPCLIFDTAHLSPGNSALDENDCHIFLNGWSIDLGHLPGRLTWTNPDRIAKLSATAQKPVAATHKEGKPSGELASSIRFTAGEIAVLCTAGLWDWQQSGQPLANAVTWKVPVSGPLDAWGLSTGWDQPLMRRLPALHPVGGVIHVRLLNVPRAELPPFPSRPKEPVKGEESRHFKTYFKVFEPGHGTDAPVLAELTPIECDYIALAKDKGREDAFRSPSTYTCMVAQQDSGGGGG